MKVEVELPETVRVFNRRPFKVEEPVIPRVAASIPPEKVDEEVLVTERFVRVVEPAWRVPVAVMLVAVRFRSK